MIFLQYNEAAMCSLLICVIPIYDQGSFLAEVSTGVQ